MENEESEQDEEVDIIGEELKSREKKDLKEGRANLALRRRVLEVVQEEIEKINFYRAPSKISQALCLHLEGGDWLVATSLSSDYGQSVSKEDGEKALEIITQSDFSAKSLTY